MSPARAQSSEPQPGSSKEPQELVGAGRRLQQPNPPTVLATGPSKGISPSCDSVGRSGWRHGGGDPRRWVTDRARPRTRVIAPRAEAALRGGERERSGGGGVWSSLVPPRHLDPTAEASNSESPTDPMWVWGPRAPPPPAPRHLGSAEATAPSRSCRGYSPGLPGARPPATPATPATASRSSSPPRTEPGAVAMSGPGGSGAAGCSDPAWQRRSPLAPGPAPWRPGARVIGCGARKPRPWAALSFQKTCWGRQRARDPGSLLGPSCGSACVGPGILRPACVPGERSETSEPEGPWGRVCHLPRFLRGPPRL